MTDILEVIQQRKSTRVPFDSSHLISKDDLMQILEAARWTPTAHNMQNFEIIVVDDKNILNTIADMRNPTSEIFVRENYQQLSFSEEELRRKKVGLLGTMFPAEMRNPGTKPVNGSSEGVSSFQTNLVYYKVKVGNSNTPNGIRIHVDGVKGRCPSPLDDGGTTFKSIPDL
jgi:nitroreductase